MTPQEQAYLRILRIVDCEPQISQRALARRIGVSVGKANYLLKALAEDGQLKLDLGGVRSDGMNMRGYHLTGKGMRERFRLSRAYLAGVEAEYDALKAEVEALGRRYSRAGAGGRSK